jgi:hypothetical protein
MLATALFAGWGTWIGISTGSPTLIGKTENASLSLLAVRYARAVLQGPDFSLHYTADLIPFARLDDVNGRGSAPLGLELRFRPGKRVQPTAGFTGGFIYFDRDVPEGGKQFNFSADLGFGLQTYLGKSVALQAGYRYHHLSNGFRSAVNPGFDSNLIFIGLVLQSKSD